MTLPEDIREAYFHDFEWPRHGACWRAPNSAAGKMGIDLDTAQRELEFLYPPTLCRQLVETEHRHLFNDLFIPPGNWWWRVERLLRLGSDLAEIPGWRDDSQLVSRLRNIGLFEPARLEVGIWAGLRRVGVDVSYVPAKGGTRSGDFLFVEDGVRVALEAKEVAASTLDRNEMNINGAIVDAAFQGRFGDAPPHSLRFTGCDKLLRDAHDLAPHAFRAKYDERLWRAVAAFYEESLPKGLTGRTSTVDGLGTFVSETAAVNEGRFGIQNIEPKTLEYETARVLRPVRYAATQLASHDVDLRVVVVLIPCSTSPVNETLPRLPHLMSKPDQIEMYKSVDAIFLLNSPPRPGGSGTTAACAELIWTRHRVRPMRWHTGLLAWRVI